MNSNDFGISIDFFEFEYLKSVNNMSGDDVICAMYDGAQEHIQDVIKKFDNENRPRHYYKQLKRKKKIGDVAVYFMPTINTYTQIPVCSVIVKVIRPNKIKQYDFSCERIQQNLTDKMLMGE